MTSARLAIDLGTSHTVAVVHRAGQEIRALLFDGSPLLPSGVAVTDDGSLVTGRDAERVAQLHPDRYEPHPKRRVDEGSVLLGDRVLPVADLLAAVLRRVVSEAGAAAAAPVLTCPADWGGPRREVLREAARRAGLGEAPLVDEPVAAAAYCMMVAGQRLYAGQALAVFDFGGGTLDVTVVRRDPDQLRVLATGGLDDLGGLDIDAAIVGHLGHLIELRDPDLWQRLSAPADPAQARDRRSFWAEARAAKEMLSRTSSAPVQIPGRPDALHLTRDELERVAGPLIARAVDETRRVVERAGVSAGALAGILLVGGSSRIPLVASRLHARLGVAPTMPEQPELPVAHGALLLGGPPPAAGPQVPAAGLAPAAPEPVSPGGWGTSGTVSGSPLFGSPAGGPVSAAPYTGGPVSGGTPPVSPAFGGGAGPVVAPRPWPAPVPARPRRRRRTVVITMTAAMLSVAIVVGGAVWLGKQLIDTLDGAAGKTAGPGSGKGETAGTLTSVYDVEVGAGAAGAVATDGETAYYAISGSDTTTVTAVPAAGGSPKWTTKIGFGAGELRLTVVDSLLVVDAQQSTLDGDARAVVRTDNGKRLWQRLWEDRFDLAYVGTDILIEKREQPTAAIRVDLRTGRERWVQAGVDNLLLIDDRSVKAARTWPAAEAAAARTGDPVSPPAGDGFREWLRVGTDVVILDEYDKRGKVVDGRTGKVRRTGKLPLDWEQWTVYEGLVVGERTDLKGAKAVSAYRLTDLREAWSYRLAAGSSISAVRPCGPKQVCVVSDPPGAVGDVVYAVNMTDGGEAWNLVAPDGMIDVGWYLVDGKIVFGEDDWGTISEPTLMDTSGKPIRAYDRSATVLCSDGARAALRGTRLAGSKVVWQVAVGDLGSGRATAGVDVGAELPAGVALAGDTVVVLTAGATPRVQVYRVALS